MDGYNRCRNSQRAYGIWLVNVLYGADKVISRPEMTINSLISMLSILLLARFFLKTIKSIVG
jgi:hypothetical protein